MYINSYNPIDKLIAFLRSKELNKNFSLKNKKILDFGCGSDFKKLAKQYELCKEITLVDRVSNDFISNNIKFINYKNDLKYLRSIIEDGYYDIIILSAVIEHLDHPENVLNILKLKLNKNGVFFLTAPGKKSKFILEFMAYKLKLINAELVAEHKRYYDEKEYNILSKKTNLSIKKFYYFEFGLNTACILC